MGLIPVAGEEKFLCPNTLSLVSFAGMTLNKCAVLRIGTLNGGPLCRLKNPTIVYMITCRLSSCKTGVYNVRLLIILKRGCSSMYRKEERQKKASLLVILLSSMDIKVLHLNSHLHLRTSVLTQGYWDFRGITARKNLFLGIELESAA